MDKNYGGIVWTSHALERLAERKITQGDAWYTWKNPHQTRYSRNKDAWIYYRNYRGQKIEVVVKKGDDKKWIVLSVWNRPLRTEKEKTPKPGLLERIVKLVLKKRF